jgi:hypothetical protein
MPHFGQRPGCDERTSGCIGHTYTVAALSFAGAGCAAGSCVTPLGPVGAGASSAPAEVGDEEAEVAGASGPAHPNPKAERRVGNKTRIKGRDVMVFSFEPHLAVRQTAQPRFTNPASAKPGSDAIREPRQLAETAPFGHVFGSRHVCRL